MGSILVDTAAADQSLSNVDNKAKGVGSTLAEGLGKAAGWGAAIVGAAAAAGAAIYGVAANAAASCDEIDKMSQRLGLSRTAYQELDFVLQQAGVEINSFTTGAKTLLTNMDKVTEGNQTAIANFAALGVEVQNADGSLRSQEEVLFDVIVAFQNMEDSSEKSRLAQELFGKQGQELLPLLNSEAGSLEELRQQAHDLGLVLDDETITAGVALTDTMNAVQQSFNAIITKIGAGVMPIIQQLLDWILQHMPEIQAVCETVFTALQVIVEAVGAVIKWLGDTFGQYMPAISDFVQKAFAEIKRVWEADLKPALTAIGNFIKTVLLPVFEFVFKNGIMPIVRAAFKYISDLWNGTLKPVFSGILTFLEGVFTLNFSKIFSGLVSTIKGIWNGIITVIKYPINICIGFINSFIRGLNKLQVPDWVPGIGGKGINIAEIPLLAKGGVLEKGQTGFLEGNGAEAVVPLENNKKWIRAVAEDMGSVMGGGETAALLEDIRDALEGIAKMGIVLDTGAMVGGLAAGMDKRLGLIQAQKARL